MCVLRKKKSLLLSQLTSIFSEQEDDEVGQAANKEDLW